MLRPTGIPLESHRIAPDESKSEHTTTATLTDLRVLNAILGDLKSKLTNTLKTLELIEGIQ
jgi:hypothetical protein